MSDLTSPFSSPRIGVVATQLRIQGGAEEVTRIIAKHFNAPIYTLDYDAQQFDDDFHEDVQRRVRTITKDETEVREALDDAMMPFFQSPTQVAPSINTHADVDKLDADFLIATDTNAAILCARSGIPFLSYLHHPEKQYTDFFWDVVETKDGLQDKLAWMRNAYNRQRKVKAAVKQAELIVCNSNRTLERTHDVWNIPRDKMKVLYPPVEVEKYLNYEAGEPPVDYDRYFLAPQRLKAYKNVHLLVKAAKRAREHIIFTGTGTLEDYVRREAQNSYYVHLFGYVDGDMLMDLYANAEATLQGTLREDFGIVPVESMAAGTPCILPASGGFLETVGNGYTEEVPEENIVTERGYLISPENFTSDYLAEVLKGFNKNDYSSEACRGQAGKFTEEKFTANIEQTVRELVA